MPCQAEWGPLRHVRVIKERNSGTSRGFAFIDFPSLVIVLSINTSYFCFVNVLMDAYLLQQGAARAMMDRLGDDGLVVDGRKLFFEYR